MFAKLKRKSAQVWQRFARSRLNPFNWTVDHSMVAVTIILAVLAWCQVSVSRDQRTRDLRAYVSINETKKQDVVAAVGKIATVELRVKNFGKTPALDVQTDSKITFMLYPLQFSALEFKRPANTEKSSITTFPEEDFTTTAKTPGYATQEDLNRLSDPNLRLYVIAQVTYRDVFGAKHWSHFCGYFSVGRPSLTRCDRYNDTDDG